MHIALLALGIVVVWFLGSVMVAQYIDQELRWRYKHQNQSDRYGYQPSMQDWTDDWTTITMVLAWPIALPLAMPFKGAMLAGRKLNERIHRTEAIVEALDGKS